MVFACVQVSRGVVRWGKGAVWYWVKEGIVGAVLKAVLFMEGL